MKNIEDLIQKAVELQSNGLVTGQIADELNVSRETVTWLLTRSKKEVTVPAPKDISVNWSSIGKSATRLHYISLALCDMVLETLEKTNAEVDVVVGVAAGVHAVVTLDGAEDVAATCRRAKLSRNCGLQNIFCDNIWPLMIASFRMLS